MKVLLRLQDIRRFIKQIFKELCEKQSGPFVLLPRLTELLLQIIVLILQLLVLSLFRMKILLVLFKLVFQKVNQLITASNILMLVLHFVRLLSVLL